MKSRAVLPAIVFAALAPAQAPLAFEVASVKPAATPGAFAIVVPSIDRLGARFTRMTLTSLIAFAYRVRTFQVSGPAWMNARSFSIDAKFPAGATRDQAPEMLRTLLEQRFQLAIHRDTRTFRVYALTVGKGGPKMMPLVLGGPKFVNGTLTTTVDGYAALISDAADRPVVNMTELEGEFLFPINAVRAEAYRQRTERTRAGRASVDGPPEEASEPVGLALYGIVKEIGLKLESRKLPMPLLVVDRVEMKPAENQY